MGAAIRSKGYALTFYIGAAFPLCMLVVRTSLLLAALSDGFIERETLRRGLTMAQLYGANYLNQRLSYRWEAAAALACAPFVGMVCVALCWLGDQKTKVSATAAERTKHRRWVAASLVILLFAAVAGTSFVVMRSLRAILPPDPAWDSHDGNPVTPSGKLIAATSNLAPGDRVLVEQGGTWWRGRVKRVIPTGNVEIHFVGWESTWDEVVPSTRLQLP